MKAIDIVNYMIANDLTREELAEVGKKLLEYVSDSSLLDELSQRR